MRHCQNPLSSARDVEASPRNPITKTCHESAVRPSQHAPLVPGEVPRGRHRGFSACGTIAWRSANSAALKYRAICTYDTSRASPTLLDPWARLSSGREFLDPQIRERQQVAERILILVAIHAPPDRPSLRSDIDPIRSDQSL